MRWDVLFSLTNLNFHMNRWWYLNFQDFINYQKIILCFILILYEAQKYFCKTEKELYTIVCKLYHCLWKHKQNKHADMIYKNYILKCFFLRWVRLYIINIVRDNEQFCNFQFVIDHVKNVQNQTEEFIFRK